MQEPRDSLSWDLHGVLCVLGEQRLDLHLGSAGPRCPGESLERAAVKQEEGEPQCFIWLHS